MLAKENLNKLTKLETIIPSKESRPQMTNTASIISFVDISNKLQICLFQWKKNKILVHFYGIRRKEQIFHEKGNRA